MYNKYVLVSAEGIKKYPYSIEQLRSDNPLVSFPEDTSNIPIEVFGVFEVASTPVPFVNPITENAKEVFPSLVNGKWTQTWEVVSATEEEIQRRKIEIKQDITAAVQERLDSFARTRGYDSILSACSYASSNHPKYGPEGRYCIQAREETWDILFAIESEVLQGIRPMPLSYEEIEDELPVLIWPLD